MTTKGIYIYGLFQIFTEQTSFAPWKTQEFMPFRFRIYQPLFRTGILPISIFWTVNRSHTFWFIIRKRSKVLWTKGLP